jgi:hypothetical protein
VDYVAGKSQSEGGRSRAPPAAPDSPRSDLRRRSAFPC